MTALPRIAEGVFKGPGGIKARTADEETCRYLGTTQGPLYREILKLVNHAMQDGVAPALIAIRVADLTLRAGASQLERLENAKVLSEMTAGNLNWPNTPETETEIDQSTILEPPAAA